MPDISLMNIVFDGNLFWLILIPVAVSGAFFVYRSSHFLRILRCMLLVLILLLLAQPILTLERRKEEKPTVILLLDGSASMQLTTQNSSQTRGMLAKDLLKSQAILKIRQHFDVHGMVFAGLVQPFSFDRIDSLTFQGEGTDIALALRQSRDEPAAGIILLSDGADNAGGDIEDEAAKLTIPVFVIGIGKTAKQQDAQIIGVEATDVGFIGKELVVKARIADQGERKMSTTVYLKGEHGEILDRKDVTFMGEGREQAVTFHTIPAGPPGLRRYTVEIPPVEGEVSTLNNVASTVVPIFKGKHGVLLIAGQPGWDFAFLRRILETMDDTEVTSLIIRREGGFLEGTFPDDLGSFDLIILIDVPSEALRGNVDEYVTAFVRQGGAMLFTGGPHTLGRGYNALRLRDLLPVRPGNREDTFRYDRFVLELTSAGQGHPVMQITGDQSNTGNVWRDLPPFIGYNEMEEVQLGAVVLGRHVTGKMPLILFSEAGNGRVFLTLCSSFWRAEFLQWGSGGSGEPIQRFLKQTVRWLTTPEALHPVTITVDRPIYRGGVPVVFEARVFDSMFRPYNEAEVLVRVYGGETVREVYLTPVGPGYYRGKISGLRAGDYRFEGTASTIQSFIGKDQGSFTIDRQSIELQETRMNEYLLKKIALKSGGKFYYPDDMKHLSDDLRPVQQVSSAIQHIEFHKNGWIWFVLLLVVGGEWMIRKRKGMM